MRGRVVVASGGCQGAHHSAAPSGGVEVGVAMIFNPTDTTLANEVVSVCRRQYCMVACCMAVYCMVACYMAAYCMIVYCMGERVSPVPVCARGA